MKGKHNLLINILNTTDKLCTVCMTYLQYSSLVSMLSTPNMYSLIYICYKTQREEVCFYQDFYDILIFLCQLSISVKLRNQSVRCSSF